MLQIYLYGPTEEGFLDIEPGTVLTMESLADAFDEDLSTGEFSLPVTLPLTDNNRRKFGFTERLENFSRGVKWWRCDVYDDYFPELLSAKITILEKKGHFAYIKGSLNASISGTKGLFGSLLQGKGTRDFSFGGSISMNGLKSRDFATALMKGQFPQYNYLGFAPVAIEDFFAGAENLFLARDTVNTVVFTGDNGNPWLFGRPLSSDPSTAAPFGHAEYVDYRTIPFFKTRYLLRRIFEEVGYTVKGPFMTSADFDDLFLFNNYAIEHYVNTGDYALFIDPRNHVPDMPAADFLRALLTLLNLYPVFTGASEVELRYREALVKGRKVMSLNGICAQEFSSTFEKAESKSGYTLNYSWDTNDSYYSERVKDLKDKNLVATVDTAAMLGTLNIGRQLTTADIAYVQADNLYYCVADATSSPIKWDAYAERLEPFVVGEGGREVPLGVSTLCTYVEYNSGTGLVERRNYLGTRQPGSYRDPEASLVLNEFGLRVFYIKMLPINGVTVPVSTNHNRDVNNQKILPYSLALKGEDGLARHFHQGWQDMRDEAEIVKTTLLADRRVVTELAACNMVEHQGVLFLPYKVERTIPLQGELRVEVMPL